MTLRPFLRRVARIEYEEAALWYERQRAGLGAQFIAEIDRTLLTACQAPQRFPVVIADIRCARVRRFPYAIFFRVRGTRLIVLSVFHARRDPLAWRERT